MQLKINVKSDRDSYAYGADPLTHLMVEFDVPAVQATDLPTLPVDLVMVLDLSGSMNTADKYPLLLRAVDTLCANLADKDRVGFIGFSDRSETILPLSAADALGSSGRRDLLHLIERCSVKFRPNTLLAPALMRSLEILQTEDTTERVKRVYCLTDGDIHDAERCPSLIKELDWRGASVRFYGFGQGFNPVQLRQLILETRDGWVKPIVDTIDVEQTFLHIAATSSRVIASDARLKLELSPGIVGGYAYQYRPLEKRCNLIRDPSSEIQIGALEVARSYVFLLEVRLPPSVEEGPTQVGLLQILGGGADAVMGEAVLQVARGLRDDIENKTVALIRDVLAGIDAADPATQLACHRAKLQLYIQEHRDPRLIEAIQRHVQRLEQPEAAHPQYEDDDDLYLQSSPSSVSVGPGSSVPPAPPMRR